MAKFVKWLRKNAQSGHQWRKNGILLVGHDPAAGELIPTNLTDAELRLILNFRQLDDDQQRSMNLLVMQMTKDNKRNAKPQE